MGITEVAESGLGDHRPHLDAHVAHLHLVERADAPQVDQGLGLGEAHVHHRDEALAAGDHPTLLAAAEQVVHLVEALRAA